MEATRLTRQGRLAEAMAILWGTATSGPGPKTEYNSESGAQPTANERQLPIIDMISLPRDGGQPRTAPWPGGEAAPAASTLLDRFRALSVPGGINGLQGDTKTRHLPDGTTFRDYSFSNKVGKRTYKLYVPSGYKGQSLPLIVMLHGCTQSPDDFAAGTRMNELAEKQMFFVVYPAQAQSANPSRCWNWFNEKEQQRDSGSRR